MTRFAPRSLEPLPMPTTPPSANPPGVHVHTPLDALPPMEDERLRAPSSPISRESADRVFVVLLIIAFLSLLARAEGWV